MWHWPVGSAVSRRWRSVRATSRLSHGPSSFDTWTRQTLTLRDLRRASTSNLCSGRLQPVLETLEYLKQATKVWFEITTLLIPGENDSAQEIEALSRWVM